MKYTLITITILSLLFTVSLATARGSFEWHGTPHSLLAKNNKWHHISEQEAVHMAERKMGGRVLSVKRVHSRGQKGYRIKVLTRKRNIRFIYIDAKTGTMMSTY
ncbi:MAG: PepSY domain-containing protein [Mariprofundaceae bacterium]